MEAVALIAGFSVLGVMVRLNWYDAAIIAAAAECVVVVAVFRPRRLVGWIPASIVTAIWIIASGDVYKGYNVFRLTVFGIAAFPVIAWATTFAFAYAFLIPLFRQKLWYQRWLRLSVAYCLGLIVVEWAGYHLLGVHLDAGLKYGGWPILNIFHCPWWMQVAYFANGIAFMGMAAWVDRHSFRILPAGEAAAAASAAEASSSDEGSQTA